jgi:uncharacterized protein involved in tolerance to divalent cations
METAATSLINQSAQYGIAMTILVMLAMAFVLFFWLNWKQQIKEKKELLEVIKENTSAFKELQGTMRGTQDTINLLIQLISKNRFL